MIITSGMFSRGTGVATFAMLVLALALPPLAWSQNVNGAINGVVTDPSGAAVAGAKVTARNRDQGIISSTVTASDGVYDLPRLPVGPYDIRVEAQGFQAAAKSNVVLVLNQIAKLDFQLSVGNVSQTVEVSSAAPLLQTEQTELGTVIDSHAIVSVPLETRNYNQLALLTAGGGDDQSRGVQLSPSHL